MKKGFTLLELVIVIGVIAILAMTAFPLYSNNLKSAQDAKVYAILGAVRSSKILYLSNSGTYPSTIEQIKSGLVENTASFLEQGTSGSSFQIKAGTVKKGAISSVGRGSLLGLNDVAEIYYDSVVGELYIDGTSGGTDYVDTKGEKWNEK